MLGHCIELYGDSELDLLRTGADSDKVALSGAKARPYAKIDVGERQSQATA